MTAPPLSGGRGPALLSYLAAPAGWRGSHTGFLGHSNAWESAELARILARLGYRVDVIDWADRRFGRRGDYLAVLDVHRNLERFASPSTVGILHVTGSHPGFSNAAERERLAALRARRGVALRPRREVSATEIARFERGLEVASLITLVGNEVTRSTFSEHHREKCELVPVTGAYLPHRRMPGVLPEAREFLWFNGTGAVHKGLDLVLEVFARNPDLILHCVGPFHRELDFVWAYRRELYELPNIATHGYLSPSDPRFDAIARRACAFLSPSCSEGVSTSALTCLQYGMVPIVSDRCGITLPRGLGVELGPCTVEEVESAVRSVRALSDHHVREQIAEAQAFTEARFSRAAFTRRLSEVLALTLDGRRGSAANAPVRRN